MKKDKRTYLKNEIGRISKKRKRLLNKLIEGRNLTIKVRGVDGRGVVTADEFLALLFKKEMELRASLEELKET